MSQHGSCAQSLFLALSLLHDAIEWLLVLAAKHLVAGVFADKAVEFVELQLSFTLNYSGVPKTILIQVLK